MDDKTNQQLDPELKKTYDQIMSIPSEDTPPPIDEYSLPTQSTSSSPPPVPVAPIPPKPEPKEPIYKTGSPEIGELLPPSIETKKRSIHSLIQLITTIIIILLVVYVFLLLKFS